MTKQRLAAMFVAAILACTTGMIGVAGATDGVDADSIRIGVLHVDPILYEQTEGVLGDVPAQWEALVEKINDGGGVDGRRLELVFATFDPFSLDSMRAACLKLTEDEKVFAVFNVEFLGPGGGRCVAIEQATPLLTFDAPTAGSFLREAKGRWISVQANASRTLESWVRELDRRGLLKGKKIGVVDAADLPNHAPSLEEGLYPTLEELGYEVTKVTVGNFADAPVQAPTAVDQMKQADADVVLLATLELAAGLFVQKADEQRYQPTYYVSDFGGLTSDIFVEAMPPSFEGTKALTHKRTGEEKVGQPEPKFDAQCRKRYERASGASLERGTDPYRGVLGACTLLQIFTDAAQKAGKKLTTASFTKAVQKLGTVDLAYFGGGSFASKKTDAADQLRTLEWTASCKCWKPVDKFGTPKT